jgi:hypothetical protein
MQEDKLKAYPPLFIHSQPEWHTPIPGCALPQSDVSAGPQGDRIANLRIRRHAGGFCFTSLPSLSEGLCKFAVATEPST